MAVKVPADVLKVLETVRQSGEINMLAYNQFLVIADRMGEYKTVLYFEGREGKKLYARGIFEGFVVED